MPSEEPPLGTSLTPKTTHTNPRFSLARVHTGHAPDDASVYHPEGERERYANGETTDKDESSEDITTDGDEEVMPEVRDGFPDERDVEKGGLDLEKKQTTKSARSARSARDPNLVSKGKGSLGMPSNLDCR